MRRSRRSRGSRKARKVYWAGCTSSGQSVPFANTGFGDTFTGWAKWPSGLINFSGLDPVDQNESLATPSDETLVRTIISTNMTLNLQGVIQSSYPVTVALGLITWDAGVQTAGAVDGVILPSGQVPNPARDFGADWIMRQPFAFTRDNFSIAPQDATFIVSRAMRKLPPRTGILLVIGWEGLLFGPEDEIEIDWQTDIRMLFKSGYYSA